MKLKSTRAELKNSLEGLINGFELAKERINKLEDRWLEIMQSEKKMMKNEQSFRKMWDTIKCTIIHIMPEEGRKEQKKYLKK